MSVISEIITILFRKLLNRWSSNFKNEIISFFNLCTCFIVTKITGITQTMLRTEKPLSVVLPLFLEWLVSAVTHVSDATSTVHYPGMLYSFPLLTITITYTVTIVLVAHNGFSFDFPILMSEVETRDNISLALFTSNSIHFSDSLPLLRSVCLRYTRNYIIQFFFIDEEGW